MTKAKKVAKTLTSVLDNEVMQRIMDRSQDMEETINEVISWWRYDLFNRKPGPAYDENGEIVGTTLDLSCFLFELAERNAVINIPSYKSMRAASVTEGQHVVSAENRHGCITNLIANKNTFSFSVRIRDMNVISEEGVGAYRTFSLTDLDGDWYDGWKKLEFIPSAKENKFIFENKMNIGNDVVFNEFVHPNRWSSIYGQYYFMTKALIERLSEEASHCFKEIKRMLDEGITYPPKEAPAEWPEKEKIAGKKIQVNAFDFEIDIPENDSKYKTYKSTQKNLVELTKKRNWYVYSVVPKLRFATRATELAFIKHGEGKVASWIKNVNWESDYVQAGKRTKWDRLVLFQPKVGEVGVSLRKRVYSKTEEVSLDYDDRKGKLRNYIAIVLDESGSMSTIRQEAIDVFNSQVEEIKKNSHDMDSKVSLVTFSTTVNKPKLWNESDLKLKPITTKDYVPNGMTALYDAIGTTIEGLQTVSDYNEPDTAFMMLIITDGEENQSRKYNKLKISNLIKEMNGTGKWTFTFFGANQDVDAVSAQLNIPKSNAVLFDATSRGVKKASFTMTMGFNNYYDARRTGKTSVNNLYDDKNK